MCNRLTFWIAFCLNLSFHLQLHECRMTDKDESPSYTNLWTVNRISQLQKEYSRSFITYASNPGGRKFPANTIGIIEANGYQSETHAVVTEDGYILEMHRILPTGPLRAKPVLLMHGNFQTSADWVANSPANDSFGFILADHGYDVWMGNHRGNIYSLEHEKLSSHGLNGFWDYSFHEMGLYDVPAMIDYVLNQTQETSLHYISFSYSTTAFFAGLSLRPEYSSKIASAIVLGPSVFQANFFYGLVYFISWTARIVDIFMGTFGTFPILPPWLARLLTTFLPVFCHPRIDLLGVCVTSLKVALGHDGGLIRREQMPLITALAPSCSGLKAWNHIVQLAGSKGFCQYDYGPFKNLERYGQRTPPDYNLTAITAPIAIIVGGGDYIAHPQDAKELASRLPNLIELHTVPYRKFTHVAFTYGREVAATQVYHHALDLMMSRDGVKKKKKKRSSC